MSEEEKPTEWQKAPHPVVLKMQELQRAIENITFEDIKYHRAEISKEVDNLIEKCSDLLQIASVLHKFKPIAPRKPHKIMISKAEGQTLARERRILEMLHNNPEGLTAREIAEKMGVDKQFIDATLSGLIKEEYVIVKDIVPSPSKFGNRKGHPARLLILNEDRINVRL